MGKESAAIICDESGVNINLPINPPNRPLYLVVADIMKAAGGAEVVAAMCFVTAPMAYKWGQDPKRSGQVVTVTSLQKLLRYAGEHLTNLDLQHHIDELLHQHFLSLCHRCAYPEERIFTVMELLQNGVKR